MYIISKAILAGYKTNFIKCSPVIKHSIQGCYTHINAYMFKHLSDVNAKLIHVPGSIRDDSTKKIHLDGYVMYKTIDEGNTYLCVQDNDGQTVISIRINKM